MGIDDRIRLTAFEWLNQQEALLGDVLPRDLLAKGFEFEGERNPLVSPQGIFKPRQLDLPLSITTTPHSPYEDSFSSDNLLLYKYRGNDPQHRDNVGLREIAARSIPMVYFHGIALGRYMAFWPVYIVGDDPAALTFTVAVDDSAYLKPDAALAVGATPGVTSGSTLGIAEGTDRRAYITANVKRRLHQRSFRENVLRAYREQCSFCSLRHYELLDAAHFIPDHEPAGVPEVQNGIALCKLHHAAFDAVLLGITPDYTIEIRSDVLQEQDGPMLRHGLQELHQAKLVLPRDKQLWPDQGVLEWRYQRFRSSG